MIKVGLTGSIGSGKSTVAKVFHALGIQIFHADEAGRELLNSEKLREQLLEIIGDSALNSDGTANRKVIADIVFKNPVLLEKLNQIIHPEVRLQFEMWLQSHSRESYTIHEAAIIFESGFHKFFNRIITVSAPEQLRISRVMQRDRIPEYEVIERMQNQWDDKRKLQLADFIVYNDGLQMILPQILEIHKQLLAIS